MFSSAISAATLGVAEGALASFLAYTRQRITIVGSHAAEDPHQLSNLGEAAADLDASRTHLLATMDRLYQDVLVGREIATEARAEARRNQVRASRRATDAVDELFRRAGGGSLFEHAEQLARLIQDLFTAHTCLYSSVAVTRGAGFFCGGGTADKRACLTVRRCTPFFSARTRCDSSGSRRPSGSQRTAPSATNPSRPPDTTVIKQHGLRHDRDRRTNPDVAGRTEQRIHSKEGTSAVSCRSLTLLRKPSIHSSSLIACNSAYSSASMPITTRSWCRPAKKT
ncbi:hypothetical protein ACFC4G_45575 [Streptomyces sp. NPDC056002]|uniref:hypothetical protein n=1 Tax=Streptomyces sp. NPDC056002 TaxID=3345675 RepID=UPI0035D95400